MSADVTPAESAAAPLLPHLEQAEVLKNEANQCFTRGEWSLAVDKYTQAIDLDNTNPVFYSNRAAALCSWGDSFGGAVPLLGYSYYERALADADKALSLDPSYLKAIGRKALVHLRMQSYEEALRYYKRALSFSPSDATYKKGLEACHTGMDADEKVQFSILMTNPEPSLMCERYVPEVDSPELDHTYEKFPHDPRAQEQSTLKNMEVDSEYSWWYPDISVRTALVHAQTAFNRPHDAHQERITIAKEALSISPVCPEAYHILAELEAQTLEDALQLYQKGKEVGRHVLNEVCWKRWEGDNWQIVPYRGYWRCCLGVASTLKKLGRYDESMRAYEEILVMDVKGARPTYGTYPNVRLVMIDLFLRMKKYKELDAFMKKHNKSLSVPNAIVADMTVKYTNLLLDYILKRDPASSLDGALLFPYYRAVSLLCGRKPVPSTPDRIHIGTMLSYANVVWYVHHHRHNWHNVPGACEWLENLAKERLRMSLQGACQSSSSLSKIHRGGGGGGGGGGGADEKNVLKYAQLLAEFGPNIADDDGGKSVVYNQAYPLLVASAEGNLNVVKFLLAKGFDPNHYSKTGQMRGSQPELGETAMHQAILYGHFEVLKALLDAGGNPNLCMIIIYYFYLFILIICYSWFLFIYLIFITLMLPPFLFYKFIIPRIALLSLRPIKVVSRFSTTSSRGTARTSPR
eukprot:TRINITY_DN6293_c0_g1_i11.p1 TRINITY_DN6293_c0_g1~~TRINITY_DN6293_c0_g1_i11.p1  ORF type:complete len:689 (+),score=82.44 TRINITY_DN6293_c0_g1_i11:43-2109(+)